MIRSAFWLFFLQLFLNAGAAELFLQGTAAYTKNEYQKAAELWQSIEPKTPAIWFNLAHAAYQQNKKIDAMVFWLRAWHQSRGTLHEQSLSHALQVMDELQVKESFLKTLPQTFWQKIPFVFWQIGMFLLLLFAAVGAPGLARKKRWYMLGALIVFLLAGAIAGFKSYRALAQPKAIIVKENVSLYAGPDEQFEVLAQVPMASLVTVQAYAQGWYMVCYQNRCGWAVGTTMALLDQAH